jgi:2-methylisocitrate lyase-like PEP mutase family enzyme
LFIESPENLAEMEAIARNFDMPLLVNMVDGGRTPILGGADLESLGFKIAIFPVTGFLAASAAMNSIYRHLKATGSSKAWPGELYPFNEFSLLMGFDKVWAFERAHAERNTLS